MGVAQPASVRKISSTALSVCSYDIEQFYKIVHGNLNKITRFYRFDYVIAIDYPFFYESLEYRF